MGLGPMNLDGVCRVLVATHVGQGIDLELCETRLAPRSTRASVRHKLSMPSSGFPSSPLRLELEAPKLELAGFESRGRVQLSLYDFGAVCVGWSFPFAATIERLVDLSSTLYANEELMRRTREIVAGLLETLDGAIAKPALTQELEDYAIFRVRSGLPTSPLSRERRLAACLLRGERRELSEQEVEDAMSSPIAYAPGEACHLDWLAALLVGTDMDDELLVLELATVELVELRVLDEELSTGIEDAYEVLARARTGLRSLAPRSAQLERIARMQADAALLYEGAANPLKLFGDDYLARLYRRAAERFHFAKWDASIERKLKVLESIYQKLSDLAAQRRSEVLEWIIILLIAMDIIVYLGG